MHGGVCSFVGHCQCTCSRGYGSKCGCLIVRGTQCVYLNDSGYQGVCLRVHKFYVYLFRDLLVSSGLCNIYGCQ